MPDVRILNWNIGGAKYLELKSRDSETIKPDEMPREVFREQLQSGLKYLIDHYHPHIITLQEVVKYSKDRDPRHARSVIDCPDGYECLTVPLINTIDHSHKAKWKKVRKAGEWRRNSYFSQGNAVLIRQDNPDSPNHPVMSHFPIWSLPKVDQNPNDWRPDRKYQRRDSDGRGCIEVVKLESGLYFGDRDTEPRAALVTHLVFSKLRDGRAKLGKPLDVFVVNLHLTTLSGEREGIPEIDQEAANTRLRQIDLVTNGVVSRYNKWKKDGFRMRNERVPPERKETHHRHPPIWVITGDFNFTPESMEYQTIVRRGFIDMMPMVGDPPRHLYSKARGFGNDPTLTLDYVFAGPRFEAIDPAEAEHMMTGNTVVVAEETRVSDHYPLVAHIPIHVYDDPPKLETT